MITTPGITIELNPLTMKVDCVKFAAATLEEENSLKHILESEIGEYSAEGDNAEP